MNSTEPRDIDAQIAEGIFGWKDRIEVCRGRSIKTATEWRTVFKEIPKGQYGHQDYGVHWCRDGTRLYCGKPFAFYFVPHYSTSISDAFLVVEKMRERGFHVSIESAIPTAPGRWFCSFSTRRDDHCEFGESAPLAICLAALRAAEKGGGSVPTDVKSSQSES